MPVAGTGYWMTASDGGVFNFGSAGFYGSMGGSHLNSPIVGLAQTSDQGGYWEVGADGGIFNFGDAGFFGSMGGQPPQRADRGHGRHPVPVGGAAGPAQPGRARATGWWPRTAGSSTSATPASTAPWAGSHLNKPIVGMTATPDGHGYWLVASDGGVFNFGDAAFYGSMGG